MSDFGPRVQSSDFVEIQKALRESFPHFQNGEPITAEAIRELGREWTEMVSGSVPYENVKEIDIEIELFHTTKHKFKIELVDNENGSSGWYLTDESQAYLESIIENALDEEAQRHLE